MLLSMATYFQSKLAEDVYIVDVQLLPQWCQTMFKQTDKATNLGLNHPPYLYTSYEDLYDGFNYIIVELTFNFGIFM